jgi:RNA polymerase sigma-70 factor (ECF subfamily)
MNAPNGLEAVFMTQRAALARYLRARQRGDGEIEDLLQDLWLKIAALEPGPIAEPTAYLYRMAENLLLDRRRAAMRRTNRETEWTKGQIDGTTDNAIDGHPSAERVLLARDHLRQVNTALAALPEKTAFAFRAVRIDGTPQKEIAATLGISLSAVEKHLQRAYRAILDIQQTTSADSEAPQRLDSGGAKHDRN